MASAISLTSGELFDNSGWLEALSRERFFFLKIIGASADFRESAVFFEDGVEALLLKKDRLCGDLIRSRVVVTLSSFSGISG